MLCREVGDVLGMIRSFDDHFTVDHIRHTHRANRPLHPRPTERRRDRDWDDPDIPTGAIGGGIRARAKTSRRSTNSFPSQNGQVSRLGGFVSERGIGRANRAVDAMTQFPLESVHIAVPQRGHVDEKGHVVAPCFD